MAQPLRALVSPAPANVFNPCEKIANLLPWFLIKYMFGNCSRDEVAVLTVDSHSKKIIRVVQSPAIYLIT